MRNKFALLLGRVAHLALVFALTTIVWFGIGSLGRSSIWISLSTGTTLERVSQWGASVVVALWMLKLVWSISASIATWVFRRTTQEQSTV
ncbi:hypothetical protein PCE31107_02951 [Pandoraea cepalis]|uniref:Uncharacterized protein n=2 Tax=Pandoraea TaxID=93217 RepID=A0A5E4XEW5_9BURK|nr:hypothetical protein PCE31107_02951 [Pandoraea cepalis]VVE34846.1 hypothetical protein PTE31013_03871 [Pandoraea terrigena]